MRAPETTPPVLSIFLILKIELLRVVCLAKSMVYFQKVNHKMYDKRVSYAVTVIFLAIFSTGIAFESCPIGLRAFPPQSSVTVSSPDSPAASSTATDGFDCHCFCHSASGPENISHLGPSAVHHPYISFIKEASKEAFLPRILRPPIFLL